MANMDGWSLVLLAAAAYLAVTILTRLMKNRHDVLISRFRREWQEEQDRIAAEEHRRRKEDRKRRLQSIQRQMDQPPEQAA
jgi:hypothetical protein